MKQLPSNLKLSHQTPEFDENSVPKGILGHHTTAAGVWGKITVTQGKLLYRILEPEVEEVMLDEQNAGIVQPQVTHQVEVIGPVSFHVEFYK